MGILDIFLRVTTENSSMTVREKHPNTLTTTTRTTTIQTLITSAVADGVVLHWF